ncbi:MAG TPA: tyrosine-type recombinase/integrase [Xanthobacteraceae bacterium]|jgi:site-specific recombinase XerD
MLLSEAITLVFQERGGLREKLQTARGYERDARQFCLFVHNPPIENVRIDDIERYFHEMEAVGFARNGIQMKACALRKLFAALRRRGCIVLDPNEIPLPRKEFKETRVATDEQIEKVLDVIARSPQRHSRVRNRAILLLLRDTGMRVGELQALNVNDVDVVHRRAVIQTKKSRGMRPVRAVFWYDECNSALKEWLEERDRLLRKRGAQENALFVIVHRGTGVARIGPTAVHIAFRKASWIAGVTPLNPHSLRHRKGHLLAKSGANNSIISGVLGHSSLASSYIYTMMNDRELEEMARQYGGE